MPQGEKCMAETTAHRPALVRTRYAETDQMGFIYHSNFFAYFEIGRCELVRATGMTYADLEMNGIQMPLKECGAQFRRAAKYDDLLAISTRVEVLTGVRIRFGYQVHRIAAGAATHLAEGFTDHLFIDRSGRPTRVHKRPEVWPALERLLALDTFPALDPDALAATAGALLR
jgi:acyl-CoA thioester hydrolase